MHTDTKKRNNNNYNNAVTFQWKVKGNQKEHVFSQHKTA